MTSCFSVGERLQQLFNSRTSPSSVEAPTLRSPRTSVDGGQQVGRDRTLEHEGVGAGFHRRPAYALLVVDAEDDHLELGTALPKRSQPAQAAVPSQRQIHDRHVGLESDRSLEQRRLVGDHDHGSERRLEQPAHAFRETVVAVRQQNAAERLLRALRHFLLRDRARRDACRHPASSVG